MEIRKNDGVFTFVTHDGTVFSSLSAWEADTDKNYHGDDIYNCQIKHSPENTTHKIIRPMDT